MTEERQEERERILREFRAEWLKGSVASSLTEGLREKLRWKIYSIFRVRFALRSQLVSIRKFCFPTSTAASTTTMDGF